MSPDRRRPPRLYTDPPVEPGPPPGMRRITFHFGANQGDISVDVSEEETAKMQEVIGHAWNNPDGRMFTISGGGRLTLVNLSLVIAVVIQ